jgi:predicted outer membrane protein
MKGLLGWVAAAAAGIFLTAAMVSAQERRESQDLKQEKQKAPAESRDPAGQAGRDQADRSRGQGDSQLAGWLVADNEGEIALGKFAAGRAQNSEVKKFAQTMADEHTEFLNKLRRISPIASTGTPEGDLGRTARDKATRPTEEPKRTQPKPDTAQTQPQDEITIRRGYRGAESRVDLLQVKQEIAKQCLETTRKELEAKSGAEFDKCYVGHQIFAHLGMADTLKVMKHHASPELRQLLEEGEKNTQKHLEQAKNLMKQLDGTQGTRPASKTTN